MVVVFAGMASGDLVVFQQVGFGLAVAVILDATIIRMVLVPASMELLGDWNWYLPALAGVAAADNDRGRGCARHSHCARARGSHRAFDARF